MPGARAFGGRRPEGMRCGGEDAYLEPQHQLLSEEFGAALEEDMANSPGYRPAGLDPGQIQ